MTVLLWTVCIYEYVYSVSNMHIYIQYIFYFLWFCSVQLGERLALHTEHVNSNTCKAIYIWAKVFALSFPCFKTRSNLKKQGPIGSFKGRLSLSLQTMNNQLEIFKINDLVITDEFQIVGWHCENSQIATINFIKDWSRNIYSLEDLWCEKGWTDNEH